MTAINAYARGRLGLIVSDTAGYDRQGVIGGFMSKVVANPRLRMAVALRGPLAALPTFASNLDFRCASFDEVTGEVGARVVEETYDAGMMHWGSLFDTEVQIVVVGWSEREQRCRALVMSSIEDGGRAAFTWWEQPVLIGPMPGLADLAAAGVLAADGGFDDRDPARALVKVAKVQRLCRLPTRGIDGEAYTVGGELIVTEVGPDGVRQTIAHHWQDRIGELINPRSDVQQLSREQLRRQRQMARTC